MNYKSTIIVELENPEKLLEVFIPELENSVKERASYKIVQEKKSLEFQIIAIDSVSLRAVLNSITKLMTVYEKLTK